MPAKKAAARKPPAKKAAKPKAKATRAAPAKADDSAEISKQIKDMGGWKGKTLARLRALIKEAVPDVVEEIKWRKPTNAMMGVPTWSHAGLICTGETYKDKLKFTFAKGASTPDPTRLFNSSLDGGTRRAIDIPEGTDINETAFKTLVRAAADLNASK